MDKKNIGNPLTIEELREMDGKPATFCQSCGRAMTSEAWAELAKRIGGMK